MTSAAVTDCTIRLVYEKSVTPSFLSDTSAFRTSTNLSNNTQIPFSPPPTSLRPISPTHLPSSENTSLKLEDTG
ncbi:hypothetical protein L1887_39831 [Cichorium endivia]|nr:hypothetical protein L1887_39831 [Cichorium endivia]